MTRLFAQNVRVSPNKAHREKKTYTTCAENQRGKMALCLNNLSAGVLNFCFKTNKWLIMLSYYNNKGGPVNGHVYAETPVPVRSPKLSSIELSQRLDKWPFKTVLSAVVGLIPRFQSWGPFLLRFGYNHQGRCLDRAHSYHKGMSPLVLWEVLNQPFKGGPIQRGMLLALGPFLRSSFFARTFSHLISAIRLKSS